MPNDHFTDTSLENKDESHDRKEKKCDHEEPGDFEVVGQLEKMGPKEEDCVVTRQHSPGKISQKGAGINEVKAKTA